MNLIFKNSPIEGTTTKERTLYVNKAQKDNHLATGTHPPTSLRGPLFFSEEDSYAMHFLHNDVLVVTTQIRRCKVSEILVDGESSVNILYGHALDRMEDTPELAQKLIIPIPNYLSIDSMGTGHVLPAWLSSQSVLTHLMSSRSSTS